MTYLSHFGVSVVASTGMIYWPYVSKGLEINASQFSIFCILIHKKGSLLQTTVSIHQMNKIS